jgi:hypothetical protein
LESEQASRVEGSVFSSGGDHPIQPQVQQFFQGLRYRPRVADRRTDRREPFPYPIYITPIDEDGSPLTEETIVVLGKHLSERGLDFYYQAPLAYRRVIASWECSDGNWLAATLDLRWCRSNRHGWYENGGRFLQVVDSPLVPRSNAQEAQPGRTPSTIGAAALKHSEPDRLEMIPIA